MGHKIIALGDGVRLLTGAPDECCIYLVEGKSSALVVDTGFGLEDIRKEIEGLTSLPYKVVNTHGHGDHSGGDMYFGEVYMSAAAEPDAREALELNKTVLPAQEIEKMRQLLESGKRSSKYPGIPRGASHCWINRTGCSSAVTALSRQWTFCLLCLRRSR